jgi:hypothetical protein
VVERSTMTEGEGPTETGDGADVGGIGAGLTAGTGPVDREEQKEGRHEVYQRMRQHDVSQRLRELNPFVLDNSLRETAVAQMIGMPSAVKNAIMDIVLEFDVDGFIVATFNDLVTSDDDFVRRLKFRSEEAQKKCWAYAEMVPDGDLSQTPTGLKKIFEYGIRNVILEVDVCHRIYPKVGPPEVFAQYCVNRVREAVDGMPPGAQVFINLRDLFNVTDMMDPAEADGLRALVVALAKLPPKYRPIGLLWEDPESNKLPAEYGAGTALLRTWVTDLGWKDCHILVHLHRGWGLGEVGVLASLSHGANGVWAAVCNDGAVAGHVGYLNTLANLTQMKNMIVPARFDMAALRGAAISICKHATGKPPDRREELYGEASLERVFGGVSMGGSSLAETFKVEGEGKVRLSIHAAGSFFSDKLIECFGAHRAFTLYLGMDMRKIMFEDVRYEERLEYNRAPELLYLAIRAGLTPTAEMMQKAEEIVMSSPDAVNPAVLDNLMREVSDDPFDDDNNEREDGPTSSEFHQWLLKDELESTKGLVFRAVLQLLGVGRTPGEVKGRLLTRRFSTSLMGHDQGAAQPQPPPESRLPRIPLCSIRFLALRTLLTSRQASATLASDLSKLKKAMATALVSEASFLSTQQRLKMAFNKENRLKGIASSIVSAIHSSRKRT